MEFKLCIIFVFCFNKIGGEGNSVEIIDMTRSTNWKVLMDFYNALDKQLKMCINCGSPSLGTAMHLGHRGSGMHPMVIPSEYLVTKLFILDVSELAERDDEYVLSVEDARRWPVMRSTPEESTLLLIKFGWTDQSMGYMLRSCLCKTPGISFNLAQWIAVNMSRVVGVATDLPTLESKLTRAETTNTVSNYLGKNGVFIIENVLVRKKMPEQGCMAISMPMKLEGSHYVPTRVSAFCPTSITDLQVTIALQEKGIGSMISSKIRDNVNLDEILKA